MVVYTNYSDIPPSPREPRDPFSGEQVKEESFGAPSEETQVCCTSPHSAFNGGFHADTLNPRNEMPQLMHDEILRPRQCQI